MKIGSACAETDDDNQQEISFSGYGVKSKRGGTIQKMERKKKGPAEGCGKIGGDAKGGGKDDADVLQVRNMHKTSRVLAMECAQWSCPADPSQEKDVNMDCVWNQYSKSSRLEDGRWRRGDARGHLRAVSSCET